MAVLKQLQLSVRYQHQPSLITCSIVFFVSVTSCLSLPFTGLCFISVITNLTVILIMLHALYLATVSFVASQNHPIALLVSCSIPFAFYISLIFYKIIILSLWNTQVITYRNLFIILEDCSTAYIRTDVLSFYELLFWAK